MSQHDNHCERRRLAVSCRAPDGDLDFRRRRTGTMSAWPAVRRWLLRILWAAVLIVATVVIGGAVSARQRLPDLDTWHRYVPADATAANLEGAGFDDYLRREATIFQDVHDRVEQTSPGTATPPANRYDRRSRSSPSRLASDWNRTLRDPPRWRHRRRRAARARPDRFALQHARDRGGH